MQNITDYFNQLLSSIPNVIVALLVLILALFTSWLVKKLVLKLTKVVGLERAMSKAGINQKNITATIRFIGKLTQLIVFLLFVPGIFEKLGLNNVATPIVSMMNSLTIYLPNIIGAVVIAIIGLFIAKIVQELIRPLLEKLGLNSWLKKLNIDSKINLSDVIATTVRIVIIIFFGVEAINTLKLDILTKVGSNLIDYLPFAIGAVIIITGAIILGDLSEKALVSKLKTSKFTGLAAKVAIITAGSFMTLSQLGIASTLINATYIILIGSVAVAFAISFGIGGRDFASHTMRKLEKKLDENTRRK